MKIRGKNNIKQIPPCIKDVLVLSVFSGAVK
jgi:hypothetical protein